MAGVAAGIVRRDLDAAFADRRGPDEIDGEPCEMGEAVLGGGAFDRPAIRAEGGPACWCSGFQGPRVSSLARNAPPPRST